MTEKSVGRVKTGGGQRWMLVATKTVGGQWWLLVAIAIGGSGDQLWLMVYERC